MILTKMKKKYTLHSYKESSMQKQNQHQKYDIFMNLLDLRVNV